MNREQIKKMVKDLDEALLASVDKYRRLHGEFDHYRGLELDLEKSQEVEMIFKAIVEEYNTLNEVFHFIKYRYEMVANEEKAFREFVDQLKEAHMVKHG